MITTMIFVFTTIFGIYLRSERASEFFGALCGESGRASHDVVNMDGDYNSSLLFSIFPDFQGWWDGRVYHGGTTLVASFKYREKVISDFSLIGFFDFQEFGKLVYVLYSCSVRTAKSAEPRVVG